MFFRKVFEGVALLALLSFIPASALAQEAQEVCTQQGGIIICQPFIQIERCLPGEPNCEPAPAPTPEPVSEPDGMPQTTEEPVMMENQEAAENVFPARTGAQTAGVVGGAILAIAGLALIFIKKIPLNTKVRYGLGAASIVLSAGFFTYGGGCNNLQPIKFCHYEIRDEEGHTLNDPESAKHAWMGLNTSGNVSRPVLGDRGPIWSVDSARMPGESDSECYARCLNTNISVYEVCPYTNKETLIETESRQDRQQWCGQACGFQSVTDFLDEATVIS